MNKYQCSVCGWIYDEETGYLEGGVDPGTLFSDLPATWTCPFCHQDKEQFQLLAD